MRIPRVFLPVPLAVGAGVELDERAHRHVVDVLRLREGAPLVLFNGEGGQYQAVLEHCGKRHSTVRIGGHQPIDRESPLRITLAQGIARGERMDFVMQKAVELGVSRLVPILTERSTVRLDAKRQERRHKHWQGVVISACEQCGRNILPGILPIRDYRQWLKQDIPGTRLVLDPADGVTLADLPADTQATILVGPEGGLSEAEIKSARDAGFTAVRLGPRVLRTETAALAILTALQVLWGDL